MIRVIVFCLVSLFSSVGVAADAANDYRNLLYAIEQNPSTELAQATIERIYLSYSAEFEWIAESCLGDLSEEQIEKLRVAAGIDARNFVLYAKRLACDDRSTRKIAIMTRLVRHRHCRSGLYCDDSLFRKVYYSTVTKFQRRKCLELLAFSYIDMLDEYARMPPDQQAEALKLPFLDSGEEPHGLAALTEEQRQSLVDELLKNQSLDDPVPFLEQPKLFRDVFRSLSVDQVTSILDPMQMRAFKHLKYRYRYRDLKD